MHNKKPETQSSSNKYFVQCLKNRMKDFQMSWVIPDLINLESFSEQNLRKIIFSLNKIYNKLVDDTHFRELGVKFPQQQRKLYITCIQWEMLLFSEKVGCLQVQLCYEKSAAPVIPNLVKFQRELYNTSIGTQKKYLNAEAGASLALYRSMVWKMSWSLWFVWVADEEEMGCCSRVCRITRKLCLKRIAIMWWYHTALLFEMKQLLV